jgi:uncharacterized membrane protein YjjP (DUF1212 family)
MTGKRTPLFDKPGKATGWGMAGCMLCYLFASAGMIAAAVITFITGLIGCWNGRRR